MKSERIIVNCPLSILNCINAQSDIIDLIDKAGNQVVSYTYDSWGKLISIDGSLKDTLGKINPYLYRGYRYDSETGLYYLQSRYYNPSWGRFINADALAGSVGVLSSHNIFSYCVNNPANQSDESGHIAPAIIYAAYMYAMSIASSPDTARDLQLVAMGLSQGDYLSAALDLIGVLVPGGTGFGQLSKNGQAIVRKLLNWISKAITSVRATKFNYRKLYLAIKPGLPRGWQVHHSLPQKYEKILKGINIHEVKYLRGVDPKIHQKITSEWARWEKSLKRMPSAQEVINYAKYIDSKYSKYWY